MNNTIPRKMIQPVTSTMPRIKPASASASPRWRADPDRGEGEHPEKNGDQSRDQAEKGIPARPQTREAIASLLTPAGRHRVR